MKTQTIIATVLCLAHSQSVLAATDQLVLEDATVGFKTTKNVAVVGM